MSTIKIESFGGEMPSVSPRALPPNAAQKHQNLYSATTEFRPVNGTGAEDTNVSLRDFGEAGGTIVRSLHRTGAGATWFASAHERSFVRTPINDLGLTGRTYSTSDNPTSPPVAFDGSGMATQRTLGVPIPAKPATTLVTNEAVTMDLAWNHLYSTGAKAFQDALRANKFKSEEPVDRFEDPAGSDPMVVYGGTRYFGSLQLPWASGNPSLPAAFQDRWWQLFMVVPEANAISLGLDTGKLNGRFHTDDNWYFPIDALPYTYRVRTAIRTAIRSAMTSVLQPVPSAEAVLTETTSDDTPDVLFTEAQVDAIIDHAAKLLDVESMCRSQRDELTELVKEFEYLLSDHTLDFFGMTPPTPVTNPTKPTGPQYMPAVDEFSQPERNTAWVTYETNLALYNQYLADVAEYEAKGAQAKQSQTDKLYHIQLRAAQLTREIESILDAKWASLVEDVQWLRDFFDSQGGVSTYMQLDYVDGVGKEDRFYVVTYVTDWGEESAPSPVSDWHYTGYRDWVSVTAPTAPSGRPEVVGWRLYRGNVGTQKADFQLVSIPSTDEQASKATFASGVFDRFNFSTTFNDKVKSVNLGEVIPTTEWLPPPAELKGLVSMPNGIMAGYVGNAIHFCEPFVPYAWPVKYELTVDSQITGLAAFGQTLFVGTTSNPYFVSGADPATMSAQKLETNQACVSRRSVATVQGGVLFASPDGLCSADASGVKVVSQGIFTREEWQALTPSSMIGIEHESVYYLFYTGSGGGCLTFDLASRKLGRMSGLTGVTAAFVDRSTDTLFVVIANEVFPVGTGTKLTGLWKSPLMTLPAQAGFGWLKVYGDQGVSTPVTVRWYGDGVLRHTATLTNIAPQRLPAGRWQEHEIEVESKARITKLVMAGTTQELQSV